jgi:arginyl-tRNA--protein-N-Asp/Glu arginylyltransferase
MSDDSDFDYIGYDDDAGQYFAGIALKSILMLKQTDDYSPAMIADLAYKISDAMIHEQGRRCWESRAEYKKHCEKLEQARLDIVRERKEYEKEKLELFKKKVDAVHQAINATK